MKPKRTQAIFPRPIVDSSEMLRAIASTLGVPVEDFTSPMKPYHFHTDDNGAEWFVFKNVHGTTMVRYTDKKDVNNEYRDESLFIFLEKHAGSSAWLSLVCIFNHLLTVRLPTELHLLPPKSCT